MVAPSGAGGHRVAQQEIRRRDGRPGRTLDICALLADDHDDMVEKALSWALRMLVRWDSESVADFLQAYEDVLAARVKREVNNKLETGLKNPRKAGRS